jgi:class 3 adenylate cyclase
MPRLPTLDEIVATDRFARMRRLAEWLGPLSPFETIATFSPAARLLLADAERDIERVLHVVRLVMFVVATVIGLFGFGLIELPAPMQVAGAAVFVAVLAVWVVVWRRLGRGHPSFGLRCVLILFDGFVVARGVITFANPGGILTAMGPDLHARVTRLITPSDVDAVTPPMLVFLALTGAFRLDPRLAVFSTLVALAIFAYLRAVVPAPANQTWVVAFIIWFGGLLGANAARVIRYIALKASQERVLQRYVPTALTQEILRSGDPDRAPRSEEITVLMSDIRGFTRLSESLTPSDAVALLNDCFATLVIPLGEEGAVLDKYIGDGLLAFFEGPGHAERAVRAARRMLAAIAEANRARPDRPPLRIGVGVHTGETLLGTLGAGPRRDYTVIGDVVNLTARLEELNKRFNSTLVVSDATRRAVPSDSADLADLTGPTTIEVRGRGATAEVYYLADGPRPASKRRAAWRRSFAAGFRRRPPAGRSRGDRATRARPAGATPPRTARTRSARGARSRVRRVAPARGTRRGPADGTGAATARRARGGRAERGRCSSASAVAFARRDRGRRTRAVEAARREQVPLGEPEQGHAWVAARPPGQVRRRPGPPQARPPRKLGGGPPITADVGTARQPARRRAMSACAPRAAEHQHVEAARVALHDALE